MGCTKPWLYCVNSASAFGSSSCGNPNGLGKALSKNTGPSKTLHMAVDHLLAEGNRNHDCVAVQCRAGIDLKENIAVEFVNEPQGLLAAETASPKPSSPTLFLLNLAVSGHHS